MRTVFAWSVMGRKAANSSDMEDDDGNGEFDWINKSSNCNCNTV